MRGTAFVIFLSMICASATRANANEKIEVCEKALQILVAKLEVEGKLSDATKVHKLPEPYADYSPCVIPAESSGMLEGISYFVFRYSNNVTVFVHKVPVPPSQIVLHGPFHSAYRK